jgi:hypothetical protein
MWIESGESSEAFADGDEMAAAMSPYWKGVLF